MLTDKLEAYDKRYSETYSTPVNQIP